MLSVKLIYDFCDYFYIQKNSEYLTDLSKLQGKYGSFDFPDLSNLSESDKNNFKILTQFCFDKLN